MLSILTQHIDALRITAPLAREGDQEVMTAVRTAGAGETIRRNSAHRQPAPRRPSNGEEGAKRSEK